MKKLLLTFCLAFITCAACSQQQTALRLWYKQPAANWNQALPVGNGRIGAMVFGDPQHETIQINEESLWGGKAINDNNPASLTSLREIQQLLLDNKNEEAYVLATKSMVSVPRTVRSYQTFMDLKIDFNKGVITEYTRDLNLVNGIATTSFQLNGVGITEEVFCSAIDNILTVRLKSTVPGGINCMLQLTRIRDAEISVQNNLIMLNGQLKDSANERQGSGGMHMKFAGAALVKHHGGIVKPEGKGLQVTGASEVLIYINASTTYDAITMNFDNNRDVKKACLAPLQRTLAFNDILKNHSTDHASKMNKLFFHIEAPILNHIPTDERLNAVKNGNIDHGLTALYFQYGRYLLLGSSRKPGKLPANLQGIWCKDVDAPWQSDFHTNINLQMNYWPAEVTGLPETVEPLIHFLDRIRKNGQVTASEMYGAKGWTMHHTTTPFGQTALHDAIEYGTYPLAGAWMCMHLWEHFLYTQDKKFLSEKAFPIMQGAATFILDFLIKDKKGFLITAPSNSPENSFIHPVTGKRSQITYAAAMDIQIITELFRAIIAAAKELNIAEAFSQLLQKTLDQLPPLLINNYGGIQEWIEDYKEAEPGHRHISHLFGLHPGTQIHEATPDFFEAAKKTLTHRLAHGGGHTGWSRAWIINFYARLKEGEKALENIQALLAKSTLSNLFDDHPPFQIDGNFGGTAGIAEMLLQSHLGTIELLPALPVAWKNGEVKGLRARGGFVVDMKWGNEKLITATFKSLAGKPLQFSYKGKQYSQKLSKGESYLFKVN